jgi:hypothetical protein
MTLQASGVIRISNINVELGRASNAHTSLNESACRILANVPSGTIRLSNFYGKTKFNAQWSGSSTALQITFGTSGNLFRFNSGAWLAAYTNGTFQSGLSYSGDSVNSILEASGNALRVSQGSGVAGGYGGGWADGWVTFSTVSKWSGVSAKLWILNGYYFQLVLETSSGYIRVIQMTMNNQMYYGAWIALN